MKTNLFRIPAKSSGRMLVAAAIMMLAAPVVNGAESDARPVQDNTVQKSSTAEAAASHATDVTLDDPSHAQSDPNRMASANSTGHVPVRARKEPWWMPALARCGLLEEAKRSAADNNSAATSATKRVAAGPVKRLPVRTGGKDALLGIASFYDDTETANGEKFNACELTAAHRTLPFGTRLRVVDLDTGRSVTVRINDRGPYIAGRIVDLSPSAAVKLGIVGRGLAKVRLSVMERGEPKQRRPAPAQYAQVRASY
jgi:rare lipoprotein A